jgi:hypothetical protein
MSKKEKQRFKQTDKVCAICAIGLDMQNAKLPWHSMQIKAKNKWINELLTEIEELKERLK